MGDTVAHLSSGQPSAKGFRSLPWKGLDGNEDMFWDRQHRCRCDVLARLERLAEAGTNRTHPLPSLRACRFIRQKGLG